MSIVRKEFSIKKKEESLWEKRKENIGANQRYKKNEF